MIASLPMYWDVAGAAAWTGLWRDIQDAACDFGLSLPDLTPPNALPKDWAAHWTDPELVLSQTCALPLRTSLKGRVTYVGTLDFGLPGPVGSYHSVCIGTAPARDIRLAVNAADSQSGWAAAQADPAVGPETRIIMTGSHAASASAVAEGRADMAFIDAVTWRLLQRNTPQFTDIPIRSRTQPTPGLPLVTARTRDPAPLRASLDAVINGSSIRGSDALGGLFGFHVWPESAYLDAPVPPPPVV